MYVFYVKSSPKAETVIRDVEETLKIRLGEGSKPFAWFPERPAELSPGKGMVWTAPKSGKTDPKYPIYIISKGRWDSRLTSKYFEWAGIDYKIVVEKQEYDKYAEVIDPKKIIVLPDSYQQKNAGGIPARNFVLDHAKKSGAKRHWICDDNILCWKRNYESERRPVKSGVCFRAVEDYVDRYTNIMMAGHNYSMFVISQTLPPITPNTRIYSSILIQNDIPFRWRGRYNEDTDLSLRVLKAGFPTVLFNCMVADKVATLTTPGGNTDSIYKAKDALLLKAQSLQKQHPDVATVVKRFNRTHHLVDYTPFKDLERKFKPGVEASLSHRDNNYGMKLIKGLFGEEKRALTDKPITDSDEPLSKKGTKASKKVGGVFS